MSGDGWLSNSPLFHRQSMRPHAKSHQQLQPGNGHWKFKTWQSLQMIGAQRPCTICAKLGFSTEEQMSWLPLHIFASRRGFKATQGYRKNHLDPNNNQELFRTTWRERMLLQSAPREGCNALVQHPVSSLTDPLPCWIVANWRSAALHAAAEMQIQALTDGQIWWPVIYRELIIS